MTLKLKSLPVFGAFVLSTLAGQTSFGAVLAGWDVASVDLDASGASGIDGNSTSSPYTFSAGTTETGIGSAKLTLSSAVNPTTTSSQYGFKISSSDEQTTLAGAISAGHYLQISVEAEAGKVLNLTSLEFFGQSSGSGADNVALFSSVGGFSAGDEISSLSGVSAVSTGGFDTDSSGFGGPISLTSSAYQGLSSVTFRLYGWNTTSGSGVTYFRNLSGNDVTLNGSVSATAVPETTSLAIGGILAAGLLSRRRKD